MLENSERENFVNQIPEEKKLKPTGFYEGIILNIATVVSAAVLGFNFSFYVSGGISYLGSVISLVVFLAFISLEVFLTKEIKRSIVVILLTIIALMTPFLGNSLKVVGGMIIVLVIFFFIGEFASRQERKTNLKVRFVKTVRQKIGKTITALVIAIIILFIPKMGSGGVFIPRDEFQSFFNLSARVAGRIYPEVNIDSTIDNVARDAAIFQLKRISDFNSLTETDKQKSITQASSKITTELTSTLGIDPGGSRRVDDLVYNLINSTLANWKEKLGDWFIIGWAIALFFVFRGIGSIISVISAGVGYLVFQLLLALDFIKIVGKNQTQDEVEFGNG